MLVSIIVPVYNVEKYLKRCLDSILNQSFKDYEVILVDDGSPDNSGNICEEYANQYEQFRVVHKDNGGLGYARNTGLEYAQGKYVMFVDSDDYIEATMVENLYNCLVENNADTCIGGMSRVSQNKVERYANIYAGRVFEGESIKSELLSKMMGKTADGKDHIEMSVCRVLFSNNIIKKYQLKFHSERELISEDTVFDLDYYSHAKVVCVSDDSGYCYCNNQASLTTKYRSNRFELQKKLYLYLLDRTKELDIYDLCHERLKTTLISNMRYCIKLEMKFCKMNGREVAKKNINSICNDYVMREVLADYRINQIPIKSRLVTYAVKYRMIHSLIFIMAFKNKFNI